MLFITLSMDGDTYCSKLTSLFIIYIIYIYKIIITFAMFETHYKNIFICGYLLSKLSSVNGYI